VDGSTQEASSEKLLITFKRFTTAEGSNVLADFDLLRCKVYSNSYCQAVALSVLDSSGSVCLSV